MSCATPTSVLGVAVAPEPRSRSGWTSTIPVGARDIENTPAAVRALRGCSPNSAHACGPPRPSRWTRCAVRSKPRRHVAASWWPASSRKRPSSSRPPMPRPGADLESLIALLDRRIAKADVRTRAIVEADAGLVEIDRRLRTVPGVGPIVAARLIAELPELGRHHRHRPQAPDGPQRHARRRHRLSTRDLGPWVVTGHPPHPNTRSGRCRGRGRGRGRDGSDGERRPSSGRRPERHLHRVDQSSQCLSNGLANYSCRASRGCSLDRGTG